MVELDGVDDSKKLDSGERTRMARQIRRVAAGIGVGVAEVAEIDSLNIYQAAMLAMRRAVEALPEAPEHVLVDARTIPELEIAQNAFSKGDGINYSIAAASIIAKTERDRIMEELGQRYPGYGLERHKGYSTRAHQEAIQRLGPCPIHRSSFSFIRELCGEYSQVFYDTQRQLFAATTTDELRACERALAELGDQLPDPERRKLRLTLTRRWKLFG
jgi:ribonuclease HII